MKFKKFLYYSGLYICSFTMALGALSMYVLFVLAIPVLVGSLLIHASKTTILATAVENAVNFCLAGIGLFAIFKEIPSCCEIASDLFKSLDEMFKGSNCTKEKDRIVSNEKDNTINTKDTIKLEPDYEKGYKSTLCHEKKEPCAIKPQVESTKKLVSIFDSRKASTKAIPKQLLM